MATTSRKGGSGRVRPLPPEIGRDVELHAITAGMDLGKVRAAAVLIGARAVQQLAVGGPQPERDARRRAAMRGIEHMGRETAHVMSFSRQRDDLADLGQRGLNLGIAIIGEPRLHRRENAGLVGEAHADDEREAEAFPIGGIQRMEALIFLRRQPVEPGGGLLGGGGIGQRPVDRRLAGELRVRADQGKLLLGRSLHT